MAGTLHRVSFRVGLLALLTVVVAAGAMLVGHVWLPPGDLLSGLFAGSEDTAAIIVREIRAPRVLLGLMVGGALGLSGAALQGLLRNPLADPGVVGVSSSAGLGAVIAIYYGLGAAHVLAIPVCAIVGALVATAVLFALAARDASVLTLILAGIAVSSLATAMTALMMNFAPTPFSLQDMVLWLMGSLSNRSMVDVALAAPFIGVGMGLLLTAGRGLDALTLGEDAARSLGINLKSLRLRVILGTALAVGGGVAVSGTVGFVGLVVPHIMRALISVEPGRLLVPSALGGAILLTLADLLTRIPVGQAEVRLGVITAFLGAPLFLYIVLRTRGLMR